MKKITIIVLLATCAIATLSFTFITSTPSEKTAIEPVPAIKNAEPVGGFLSAGQYE